MYNSIETLGLLITVSIITVLVLLTLMLIDAIRAHVYNNKMNAKRNEWIEHNQTVHTVPYMRIAIARRDAMKDNNS